MTLFKPNLTFGPSSHLINYLTQCAIVGKCPRKNLLSKENKFEFNPIFLGDVASAVDEAFSRGCTGKYTLSGEETLSMRGIMDALETAAGKTPGSIRGPLMPPLDYVWDFFVGTTPDLNMARMIDFYEKNPSLADDLKKDAWYFNSGFKSEINFTQWASGLTVEEEDYSYPSFSDNRCAHTN